MTVYYVNKSGDDANGGTDPATDAKRSIKSGAALLASSSDKLIVGSGVYQENDISVAATFDHVFEADGYVVLDGEFNSRLFYGARWDHVLTMTGFHLKNAVYLGYGSSYSPNMRLFNCRISNITTSLANGASNSFISMEDCVVTDCGRLTQNGTDGGVSLVRTLLYNMTGSPLVTQPSNGNLYKVQGCIFRECPGTLFQVKNISTAGNHADNYYNCGYGTFAIVNGVTYSTLADFKAAFAGYELGSNDDVDPLLVDPTLGILYPRSGSPVVGPGVVVPQIGPWTRVINFCSAVQYSGDWDVQASPAADAGTKWARTSGGVAIAGTRMEGEGVVVSPVWDLGASLQIKRFMGTFSESYPSEVIDYDNSDSAPNRKNLRYRVSDTPFNQDGSGGAPAWVVHEFEEALSAINGRYLQVELTFRTDGVEA